MNEPGWFLPYEAVKHLTSLPTLLAHAKRAHYTNATVRKDGKETVYEADWIKHMRWIEPATLGVTGRFQQAISPHTPPIPEEPQSPTTTGGEKT